MYRPAYTYRGSPIIPGGRGSYRPGGRRNAPSPWKIIALIAVIVGLIALCWFWIASASDGQDQENINTTRPVVDRRSQNVTEHRQNHSASQEDAIPSFSEDAGEGVSLAQQKNCRQAEALLKKRKYEEARNILESLLLELSTGTPFYQHVVKLLNLAADELLASNQFVPPYTTYTVKSGDNLTVIARKHKTSMNRIIEASELPNANRLRIGMELKIPTNTWNATIFVKTKRVMIYENKRLIKVYQLHFDSPPNFRYNQYSMSSNNNLWKQVQMNASDIRDIRKFLPVGTSILIENDK